MSAWVLAVGACGVLSIVLRLHFRFACLGVPHVFRREKVAVSWFLGTMTATISVLALAAAAFDGPLRESLPHFALGLVLGPVFFPPLEPLNGSENAFQRTLGIVAESIKKMLWLKITSLVLATVAYLVFPGLGWYLVVVVASLFLQIGKAGAVLDRVHSYRRQKPNADERGLLVKHFRRIALWGCVSLLIWFLTVGNLLYIVQGIQPAGWSSLLGAGASAIFGPLFFGKD
jgi:hypothetical protein